MRIERQQQDIGGTRRHRPGEPAVCALLNPQGCLGIEDLGCHRIDEQREHPDRSGSKSGGYQRPAGAGIGALVDAAVGSGIEIGRRLGIDHEGVDALAWQDREQRRPGLAGIQTLENRPLVHHGIESAGRLGIDCQVMHIDQRVDHGPMIGAVGASENAVAARSIKNTGIFRIDRQGKNRGIIQSGRGPGPVCAAIKAFEHSAKGAGFVECRW